MKKSNICCLLLKSWIHNIPTLIPFETFENNEFSDDALIDFANDFVLTTKTKPPENLMNRIIAMNDKYNNVRDLVFNWIEIFSELPPEEIMDKYDEQGLLCLINSFICKFEVEPPEMLINLISDMQSKHSESRHLAIAWIEGFGKVPPEGIINSIENNDMCYVASAFIDKFKIKPPEKLMHRILLNPNCCGRNSGDKGSLAESWIEAFFELPPAEIMNTIKSEVHIFRIVKIFIDKTKTKPPDYLMYTILNMGKDDNKNYYGMNNLSKSWIEAFSEMPPEKIINNVYDNNLCEVIITFINKTKTKPPENLINRININNKPMLTKLYEIWIKTFYELPVSIILDNVTRIPELEILIVSKQKSDKIKELINAQDIINTSTIISEIQRIINSTNNIL